MYRPLIAALLLLSTASHAQGLEEAPSTAAPPWSSLRPPPSPLCPRGSPLTSR